QCNIEYEYLCLLGNVDQPWNFTKYCPCINFTRIGDGNIGCYGQQDERNIQRCKGKFLIMGYNFLCPTSLQCIFYESQCKEVNICENGEDDFYLPFVYGNDELAVKYQEKKTICFYPPNSSGNYCQYSSDRITILTHLDLKDYKIDKPTTLKVLLTFLFNNQVIDINQFYIQTVLQNNEINYIKEKNYFVYPCIKESIDLKRRYRHGLSIYYDYLPSYHLAKILKLNSTRNTKCSMCGHCYRIINNNYSIYCKCHHVHVQIIQFCHLNQCGIRNNGKQKSYCSCLSEYFGSNCYLKHDQCTINRCKNNGICFIDYILDDFYQIKCLYIKNKTSSQIQAIVVQYYDLKEQTYDMLIHQQQ
ncbi:unnamed protein product, partial [Rotaria sp. Silwood2]